jgi:K+-transporting ATPase ATPase A chain
MSDFGFVQLIVFVLVLFLITKPLGLYMARVFQGQRTFLHPVLRPIERLAYRLTGIHEEVEQTSRGYTASVLSLSLFGLLLCYGTTRLQFWLPLNPGHFKAFSPDLAFATATGALTNTIWQSYSPETAISYCSQMIGLTVNFFLAPAIGMAVAVALIRGLVRQEAHTVGHFWVDVTRAIIHVLIPLSFFAALVLCGRGVIQNFASNRSVPILEGGLQEIPQGPVASQEAIKILGTNGGGFFNANSAHPYENPDPISNFFQALLMACIPAGLTYTFGKLARDTRQGWSLFATMMVLFLAGAGAIYWAEKNPAPAPAINMEGKEVRFGIGATALYAAITTATGCGAVNAMHDSLQPLSGAITMFNMQSGEAIFGGVGAGLYSILIYAVLAVFIGGLMVGRSPEYLGKKIDRKETQMVMIVLLAPAAAILLCTALSTAASFSKGGYWNPPGSAIANMGNTGPHGFSEVLYDYSSAAANNGSAFSGLNTNTPWYNLTLGLAMLAGRYLVIIPVLAIAGDMAAKKRGIVTVGSLPTTGMLFVVLLAGTIVIVGALTFFPALSLGPLAEYFRHL